MKRDYMIGFSFIFFLLFLPPKDSYLLLILVTPLTLSYSPVLQFLCLFFLLPMFGGWGKMTVTLAIDSALTHQAPTQAQTHWFLFGMSQESTKKLKTSQIWKMELAATKTAHMFTQLVFSEGRYSLCIGKGLLLNYVYISKLVLTNIETLLFL